MAEDKTDAEYDHQAESLEPPAAAGSGTDGEIATTGLPPAVETEFGVSEGPHHASSVLCCEASNRQVNAASMEPLEHGAKFLQSTLTRRSSTDDSEPDWLRHAGLCISSPVRAGGANGNGVGEAPSPLHHSPLVPKAYAQQLQRRRSASSVSAGTKRSADEAVACASDEGDRDASAPPFYRSGSGVMCTPELSGVTLEQVGELVQQVARLTPEHVEGSDALFALADLVEMCNSRDASRIGALVRSSGALGVLTALLEMDDSSVLETTLFLIGNLASELVDAGAARTKQMLLGYGAFQHALPFLWSEEENLLYLAVGALQNMCCSRLCAEQMIRTGAEARLIELRDGQLPENVVELVQGCLDNISKMLQDLPPTNGPALKTNGSPTLRENSSTDGGIVRSSIPSGAASDGSDLLRSVRWDPKEADLDECASPELSSSACIDGAPREVSDDIPGDLDTETLSEPQPVASSHDPAADDIANCDVGRISPVLSLDHEHDEMPQWLRSAAVILDGEVDATAASTSSSAEASLRHRLQRWVLRTKVLLVRGAASGVRAWRHERGKAYCMLLLMLLTPLAIASSLSLMLHALRGFQPNAAQPDPPRVPAECVFEGFPYLEDASLASGAESSNSGIDRGGWPPKAVVVAACAKRGCGPPLLRDSVDAGSPDNLSPVTHCEEQVLEVGVECDNALRRLKEQVLFESEARARAEEAHRVAEASLSEAQRTIEELRSCTIVRALWQKVAFLLW